jgi:allophanate hydrolase subunit 1
LELQLTAQAYFLDALSDSVVGYATLTLFFMPLSLQRDQVTAWLENTARSICDSQPVHAEHNKAAVVLPVFYDPAVAPDLLTVADDLGMTIDALITLPQGFAISAHWTHV